MENKNSRPTQCDRVLCFMVEHGHITTLEAMLQLGVARLASRIFELKQRGYLIDKKRVQHKNRYGEKVYFDSYFIHDDTKE